MEKLEIHFDIFSDEEDEFIVLPNLADFTDQMNDLKKQNKRLRSVLISQRNRLEDNQKKEKELHGILQTKEKYIKNIEINCLRLMKEKSERDSVIAKLQKEIANNKKQLLQQQSWRSCYANCSIQDDPSDISGSNNSSDIINTFLKKKDSIQQDQIQLKSSSQSNSKSNTQYRFPLCQVQFQHKKLASFQFSLAKIHKKIIPLLQQIEPIPNLPQGLEQSKDYSNELDSIASSLQKIIQTMTKTYLPLIINKTQIKQKKQQQQQSQKVFSQQKCQKKQSHSNITSMVVPLPIIDYNAISTLPSNQIQKISHKKNMNFTLSNTQIPQFVDQPQLNNRFLSATTTKIQITNDQIVKPNQNSGKSVTSQQQQSKLLIKQYKKCDQQPSKVQQIKGYLHLSEEYYDQTQYIELPSQFMQQSECIDQQQQSSSHNKDQNSNTYLYSQMLQSFINKTQTHQAHFQHQSTINNGDNNSSNHKKLDSQSLSSSQQLQQSQLDVSQDINQKEECFKQQAHQFSQQTITTATTLQLNPAPLINKILEKTTSGQSHNCNIQLFASTKQQQIQINNTSIEISLNQWQQKKYQSNSSLKKNKNKTTTTLAYEKNFSKEETETDEKKKTQKILNISQSSLSNSSTYIRIAELLGSVRKKWNDCWGIFIRTQKKQ